VVHVLAFDSASSAQQFATYIGWLMHRGVGVAGALFVLPSLFILIGLSRLYMAFGDAPVIAGLLYGIKPAVSAIVIQATHRIGGCALRNNLCWAIAAAALIVFKRGVMEVIAACALSGLAARPILALLKAANCDLAIAVTAPGNGS
jgi:chromate transporter